MQTIDDTFDRLRRSPFEAVDADLEKGYAESTCVYFKSYMKSPHARLTLEMHRWTLHEYSTREEVKQFFMEVEKVIGKVNVYGDR